MNLTLMKILKVRRKKKREDTSALIVLLFFYKGNNYYSHNALWIVSLNLFYPDLNNAAYLGDPLPDFRVIMLDVYLGAGDFSLLDHDEGWSDESSLSHIVDWVIGHGLQQVYRFLHTSTNRNGYQFYPSIKNNFIDPEGKCWLRPSVEQIHNLFLNASFYLLDREM